MAIIKVWILIQLLSSQFPMLYEIAGYFWEKALLLLHAIFEQTVYNLTFFILIKPVILNVGNYCSFFNTLSFLIYSKTLFILPSFVRKFSSSAIIFEVFRFNNSFLSVGQHQSYLKTPSVWYHNNATVK